MIHKLHDTRMVRKNNKRYKYGINGELKGIVNNKKVVIKWVDATIYFGVHNMHDALELKMEILETLGFFIEKNDEATVICLEINDRGAYKDILLIPSGSVISIQELEISPSA